MKRIRFLLMIFCVAFFAHGCAPTVKPFSKTEADTSFLKIIKEEFGYQARLFRVQDTLWIYFPVQDRDFYKIVSAPASSTSPKKKFTLEYIKGTFQDKTFNFEYDIINATKVASGSGVTTQPTDEFNAFYRNVLSAVSRCYFNTDTTPPFIVLVLADIKKGIESQNTFCLLDLKKYYASALPPDEYSLRVLNESSGDTKIIGDAEGHHLEPKAISWPEFLNKQIAQRVRYKFQNSALPPEETPQAIILKIIAATVMIYDFKDYDTVVLSDLRNRQAENFTRSQIEAMQDTSLLGEKKPTPEGKVITIDFSKEGDEQFSETPVPAESKSQPSPAVNSQKP
ncbi:MAG: hypothetical protein NT079_04910 [Candidatus Omnitrophica bacterium]|nr:hypothetical protein [Candidatus Omnitrophota bacterium]